MKKYMAVIAALMIGLNSSSLEMTALAGQIEEEGQAPGGSKLSDMDMEEKQQETNEKEAVESVNQTSELTNLQIPQKLGVVLDPWEMDGNTQIYSEEYTIQNVGEAPGTLVLSFACKSQESSGVIVKAEKEGLHDDESKSLFMKIVFGNGEELILSEEFSEYQIEMGSGEELSLCFQGELNENAADPWKNGDIEVEGVYLWKTEEEEPVEDTGDEKKNAYSDIDIDKEKAEPAVNKEEVSDSPLEEGKEKAQKEETSEEKVKDKDPQKNERIPESGNLQETKDGQENGKEEEHRESVDLKESQEWKVALVLDSWGECESEGIAFAQYLLRNSGETVGRLVLEDIVWETQEEGNADTDITARGGIDDDSHKSCPIHAEMVLGNEERAVLIQESIGYEIEVKPGEELAVDFIGQQNQISEWEDGAIEMTIIYSWNVDERITW